MRELCGHLEIRGPRLRPTPLVAFASQVRVRGIDGTNIDGKFVSLIPTDNAGAQPAMGSQVYAWVCGNQTYGGKQTFCDNGPAEISARLLSRLIFFKQLVGEERLRSLFPFFARQCLALRWFAGLGPCSNRLACAQSLPALDLLLQRSRHAHGTGRARSIYVHPGACDVGPACCLGPGSRCLHSCCAAGGPRAGLLRGRSCGRCLPAGCSSGGPYGLLGPGSAPQQDRRLA